MVRIEECRPISKRKRWEVIADDAAAAAGGLSRLRTEA